MVDYSTTAQPGIRALRRRADRELLLTTLKFILAFIGIAIGIRIFHGNFMAVLALSGVVYAAKGQMGMVLFIYLLIPFLTIFNPVLLPKIGTTGFVARIATLAITATLIFTASQRRGNDQIPMGSVFFFLVAALISSIQGWFPLISYLKLINVSIFFSGIYFGTRNIGSRPRDIFVVRCALLSFACIIVFGSVLTLPFPHIGYFTSLQNAFLMGGSSFADEIFYSSSRKGINIFCGVTVHSQFLAPFLACISGWVCCDMILVEKRAVLLHVVLLATIPFLLYLTRSRAGVLAYSVSWAIILGYSLRHAQAPFRLRRRIKRLLWVGFLVLLLIAAYAEVRNQAISKLVRKTNQVQDDTRSLSEAVTATRRGLINRCLYEFMRNPMLGSGFQVQEEHRELYEKGRISIYSAPIEKGVLPLMVLGETGMLGGLAFFAFLVVFLGTCFRRRYIATASLFIVFFFTNMAEATFFAPSGGGGVMWLISVVGGFVIDMNVKNVQILTQSRDAIAGTPHSPFSQEEGRGTGEVSPMMGGSFARGEVSP